MGLAPKVGIKDIHKMPLAYALLTFGLFLGWLLPKAFSSKDETIATQDKRIDKLNKTIEFYRTKDALKDSLLRIERDNDGAENTKLKRSNDSLQKLLFDTKTEGLERVIKIIENGKTSVVIKPGKK
ncbi:hypothetical protein [Pedobacter sp. Leaf132]|uniref:hypothetical protein n=1 Tax=Pedobacter sp. Leaf132 TaxID=2876557 RepID=UPI001E3C4BE7|nr:hypothetical protein [Pedobacter sp. Leaf132]